MCFDFNFDTGFFSMICDSQFCVVCEELPTNDLLICGPTISLLSIFFMSICVVPDLRLEAWLILYDCLSVPQCTSNYFFNRISGRVDTIRLLLFGPCSKWGLNLAG